MSLTSRCQCLTRCTRDYRSAPQLSRSSCVRVVSLLICSLNESEFACTPLADARSRPRPPPPRPGDAAAFFRRSQIFPPRNKSSAIAQECDPGIYVVLFRRCIFSAGRYLGVRDVLCRLDFTLDEISPPRIKNNVDYPPQCRNSLGRLLARCAHILCIAVQ